MSDTQANRGSGNALVELLETFAAAILASLFVLEEEAQLVGAPIAVLLIGSAVILRLRSSSPSGAPESSPDPAGSTSGTASLEASRL